MNLLGPERSLGPPDGHGTAHSGKSDRGRSQHQLRIRDFDDDNSSCWMSPDFETWACPLVCQMNHDLAVVQFEVLSEPFRRQFPSPWAEINVHLTQAAVPVVRFFQSQMQVAIAAHPSHCGQQFSPGRTTTWPYRRHKKLAHAAMPGATPDWLARSLLPGQRTLPPPRRGSRARAMRTPLFDRQASLHRPQPLLLSISLSLRGLLQMSCGCASAAGDPGVTIVIISYTQAFPRMCQESTCAARPDGGCVFAVVTGQTDVSD